jgi:hypothetical protein
MFVSLIELAANKFNRITNYHKELKNIRSLCTSAKSSKAENDVGVVVALNVFNQQSIWNIEHTHA